MGCKLRNEIINDLEESFLKDIMGQETYEKSLVDESDYVTIRELKWILLRLAEVCDAPAAHWLDRDYVESLAKKYENNTGDMKE